MTFIQRNGCKEVDLILNEYGYGLYDDLSALNNWISPVLNSPSDQGAKRAKIKKGAKFSLYTVIIFHADIIILHVNINKLHDDIIILYADIIISHVDVSILHVDINIFFFTYFWQVNL